ncbi:MAG TPA: hypothetical protein VGB17_15210 [Pyrinomonadaceae bacterium]|jgi:heme O synthase-like polyprenyltransferase
MSRRPNVKGGRQKQRGRGKTFFWIAALAIVTIALIYYEQAAILYILATLGVTAILIIVALANLKDKVADEPLPADDSAAIGSGITATLPQTATKPQRTTRAARRGR